MIIKMLYDITKERDFLMFISNLGQCKYAYKREGWQDPEQYIYRSDKIFKIYYDQ